MKRCVVVLFMVLLSSVHVYSIEKSEKYHPIIFVHGRQTLTNDPINYWKGEGPVWNVLAFRRNETKLNILLGDLIS